MNTALAPADGLPLPQRYRSMAVILLGISMAVLDGSIVDHQLLAGTASSAGAQIAAVGRPGDPAEGPLSGSAANSQSRPETAVRVATSFERFRLTAAIQVRPRNDSSSRNQTLTSFMTAECATSEPAFHRAFQVDASSSYPAPQQRRRAHRGVSRRGTLCMRLCTNGSRARAAR
jgi:hypothetical protein